MSYICLVALIVKHGSTPVVSTKAKFLAEKVKFSPGYVERWHIKASSEMLKALSLVTIEKIHIVLFWRPLLVTSLDAGARVLRYSNKPFYIVFTGMQDAQSISVYS